MSAFTLAMRIICDQTRIRLRHEIPLPNALKYAVRGPWIYLEDDSGTRSRIDMNLIKQSLIDALTVMQISIFEHNQYIALLQLMEVGAQFPKDFWIWDFDFEFQMTIDTWLMVVGRPVEHTHWWPDPTSVAEFPDIASVSSLHYSESDYEYPFDYDTEDETIHVDFDDLNHVEHYGTFSV